MVKLIKQEGSDVLKIDKGVKDHWRLTWLSEMMKIGKPFSSGAKKPKQPDELLAEFRRHHEGPEPSRKLRDNVTSKIFRIRAFVAYVAEGKSRLATLRFMDDPERMRTWVTNLRASKMTETTLNHYLNNVAQFLDYIHETPPPTSRLSKKSMLGIRREVRALLKGLRRGVVMHQIGVKQAKEGRVIPKAVLRQCLSEAKKRIPEVLDQLENDLQQKTQFSFYGYLTAYYASIYGHRLGVFQNLTIREVEGAVKSPSTGDYLINISLHKTNRAFGPAQLSLTAEEYGWFRRFLALRDRLVGGPDARLFFYTSTPNPCKNLNNYFQGAWVSMGLPGKPTFMDVRTSRTYPRKRRTHARNTHSKADREKVSKFMCHDTSTADRFYAMNLNVKQAVEHRRLFQGALVGEEVSPANPAAEVE
ncbi:uncharacterized protein [Misgurnus anguillicaudatus]|uniref:uncharacterized protein n=1 Tax=Misgurnus anguillicaudatus TaxID=75329 RepID=UPI003CCF561F